MGFFSSETTGRQLGQSVVADIARKHEHAQRVAGHVERMRRLTGDPNWTPQRDDRSSGGTNGKK